MSSDVLTTFADGQSVYTWYDRQSRNWITQLRDSQKNQIGNAEFSGNKKSANITHKYVSSLIQEVNDEW